MNWVDFLDERLPVDWDTPLGEELAETFVMSNSVSFSVFSRYSNVFHIGSQVSFSSRSLCS